MKKWLLKEVVDNRLHLAVRDGRCERYRVKDDDRNSIFALIYNDDKRACAIFYTGMSHDTIGKKLDDTLERLRGE